MLFRSAPRLTFTTIKILCAHLIRHPDRELFARLYAKFEIDRIAFDTESAGVWFALLCTAGVVGDQGRLHSLVVTLKLASNSPFQTLSIVEAFFRRETGEEKITSFLPMLPLPIEIDYALIEHYAAKPRSAGLAPARKP